MQINPKVLVDAENRARRESLRDRVHDKTPGVCWYCGDPVSHKTKTMDHVIPRAKGGQDTYENLVPCCKDCNRIKGDRSISDLRRRLRWRLAGMPEFSAEQAKWLFDEHGIDIEPPSIKLWFEENT